MEKTIEINLGVGMDQIFPKPIKIIVESEEELVTNDSNISDESNLNNKINNKI